MNLKSSVANGLSAAVNVLPLAAQTVETTFVVANSWLAELVNEDAKTAMERVNTIKQLMLNGNPKTVEPTPTETTPVNS